MQAEGILGGEFAHAYDVLQATPPAAHPRAAYLGGARVRVAPRQLLRQEPDPLRVERERARDRALWRPGCAEPTREEHGVTAHATSLDA